MEKTWTFSYKKHLEAQAHMTIETFCHIYYRINYYKYKTKKESYNMQERNVTWQSKANTSD